MYLGLFNLFINFGKINGESVFCIWLCIKWETYIRSFVVCLDKGFRLFGIPDLTAGKVQKVQLSFEQPYLPWPG